MLVLHEQIINVKKQIAHIINPFNASPTSDLFTAQPITFASMRYSKKLAEEKADIELWSAQYSEDRNMVPKGFNPTRDLDRSVQDYGNFKKPSKLPLIGDIIDRLFECSNAEYFIYTNVDIGVYPDFYSKVCDIIDSGVDAFIINRRRLPAQYTKVDELPQIYQEKGKSHPGFDCFVFKRSLVPQMRFEKVCIGVPFIGITFAQNLFALAHNFRLFEKEFLTFHIGMEIFKRRATRDFFRYNRREFWKAMNSDLKQHQSSLKLPYNDSILPIRWIKWGLHPSIPIRFALLLEFRRFLRSIWIK